MKRKENWCQVCEKVGLYMDAEGEERCSTKWEFDDDTVCEKCGARVVGFVQCLEDITIPCACGHENTFSGY